MGPAVRKGVMGTREDRSGRAERGSREGPAEALRMAVNMVYSSGAMSQL